VIGRVLGWDGDAWCDEDAVDDDSSGDGDDTAMTGDWVAVTAGKDNSCGIRTSGAVICWGIDKGSSDDHGQVTSAHTHVPGGDDRHAELWWPPETGPNSRDGIHLDVSVRNRGPVWRDWTLHPDRREQPDDRPIRWPLHIRGIDRQTARGVSVDATSGGSTG
jgi:hypothetical protein